MKREDAVKKIVAAILLGLATACGAQSLLSGTVELPDGSAFTGVLYFSLTQNGAVSSVSPCTGPLLVLPTSVIAVKVTSGALVSPPTLISSTCTIPLGIPYNVTAVDAYGNTLFHDQWLVTGTTFNVGTAVSSNPSPTVNYRGLWSSTTTYYVGDLVGYGAPTPQIYVSLLANNIGNIPASSATYWQLLGGGGAIANGTLSLATSSISSGTCQTVTAGSVNSAAATGANPSTDTVSWVPNASLSAVTGFAPSTSGGLSITPYLTSGYVNFDVCNWSGSTITPGAVTVVWQVLRR